MWRQKGMLTTFPQCNISLEFPKLLSQNLICYHSLSVSGNSEIMHCGILINMPYYPAWVILGSAVIVPFGVIELLLVVEKMLSFFTAKQWMLQSCPFTGKHCQWAWTSTQQAFRLLYLIRMFYNLYFSCAELCSKPTVQRSSEKIKKTICRRSSEGGMLTCLNGDTVIQESANRMALLH